MTYSIKINVVQDLRRPNRIPMITVHGRFQPPLHKNHWAYIEYAFNIADHVEILITNPSLDEFYRSSAPWRNQAENNPFSYNERVQMFISFFDEVGIKPNRYRFRPFNITSNGGFDNIDRAHTAPNLINVYSPWSEEKARLFKNNGLQVIEVDLNVDSDISGSRIRDILSSSDVTSLEDELIKAGFMPEAIPGLLRVLSVNRNL